MTHLLKRPNKFLVFLMRRKSTKICVNWKDFLVLFIFHMLFILGSYSSVFSFSFLLLSQKHLGLKWSRELVFIPLQTNIFSSCTGIGGLDSRRGANDPWPLVCRINLACQYLEDGLRIIDDLVAIEILSNLICRYLVVIFIMVGFYCN
jgi:hypothetical protein